MKTSRLPLIASILGWTGVLVVIVMLSSNSSSHNVVNAEPDVKGTPTFQIKNPIDKFVLARLQSEKIDPSLLCSDEEFLRRVYLDICGSVPPLADVKAYMLDRTGDRRMKLVDRLLKSDRYAAHWSVMWSDLLREHTQSRPQEGTERGSYREWMQESLTKNVPYDVFVKTMIEAVGDAEEDGSVNFYLRDAGNGMQVDKAEIVNNVATVFMGTRMACAQCHDHPFDKWTQTDFHSLMAFFGRTNVTIDPWATLVKIENSRRLPTAAKPILEPLFKEAKEKVAAEKAKFKKGVELADASAGGMMGMGMGVMDSVRMFQKGGKVMQDLQAKLTPAEMLVMTQLLLQGGVRRVSENGFGEYRMPVEGDDKVKNGKGAGEIMEAKFPWDPTKVAVGKGSRRVALAEYVTSNRQFAKVQVNRIWAHMMGHGIVDPIDDFRDKNKPSNPELLEFLTDEFITSKYDNKHMIELIAMSSTYQRSSMPNASNRSDTALFSHATIRRLTAEQTFDSLLVSTGKVNGMTEASAYGMGMGKEAIGNRVMEALSGQKNKTIQWAEDLPTPAQPASFMAAFNQPDRNSTVSKRDESGSITQALEMMNGERVDGAIKGSPLIKQILDSKLNGPQAAQELFLAVLTRNPTSREMSVVGSQLRSASPTKEWLEDMYWALLNTREFTYVK
ncbi:MAG: DUF1549 and DUF1553 domain-containing protein [Planctomycetota bacterium]